MLIKAISSSITPRQSLGRKMNGNHVLFLFELPADTNIYEEFKENILLLLPCGKVSIMLLTTPYSVLQDVVLRNHEVQATRQPP